MEMRLSASVVSRWLTNGEDTGGARKAEQRNFFLVKSRSAW